MPSSQTSRKLVCVIGCQRSGTTLTGQILGAHPNAVLIDETDGVYDWFDALSPDDPLAPEQLAPALRKAARNYRAPESRIDLDGGARLTPQVTHLILKSPNLTYAWDRLAALPMDVRIVGLIRDPRAVVTSMGRLAHIPMVGNQVRWIEQSPDLARELADELAVLKDPSKPDILKRAMIWQIKTRLIDRFSGIGLTCRTIRYETLVDHPQAIIPPLLDALGLPPDDAVYAHQDLSLIHI